MVADPRRESSRPGHLGHVTSSNSRFRPGHIVNTNADEIPHCSLLWTGIPSCEIKVLPVPMCHLGATHFPHVSGRGRVFYSYMVRQQLLFTSLDFALVTKVSTLPQVCLLIISLARVGRHLSRREKHHTPISNLMPSVLTHQ